MIRRSRVHDSGDDHIVDGGLHSPALHGWNSWPAVPRVRRYHRNRDPGVGIRIADPDADAVEPVPQAAVASARSAVQRIGARVRAYPRSLLIEPRLGDGA